MLGSPGTPATEAIRFPTRGPTNRNRKVSLSWGATFGSWAEAANLTVDTPKARIPIFRQNRGIHIFRHLFASATYKSQKRWRLARVKIKFGAPPGLCILYAWRLVNPYTECFLAVLRAVRFPVPLT